MGCWGSGNSCEMHVRKSGVWKGLKGRPASLRLLRLAQEKYIFYWSGQFEAFSHILCLQILPLCKKAENPELGWWKSLLLGLCFFSFSMFSSQQESEDVCNLPVFALVAASMTWGSWWEERHCAALNSACATDGDLMNEARPKPFASLMLIKQSSPQSRFASKYLICIWLTLALLRGWEDEEVGGLRAGFYGWIME